MRNVKKAHFALSASVDHGEGTGADKVLRTILVVTQILHLFRSLPTYWCPRFSDNTGIHRPRSGIDIVITLSLATRSDLTVSKCVKRIKVGVTRWIYILSVCKIVRCGVESLLRFWEQTGWRWRGGEESGQQCWWYKRRRATASTVGNTKYHGDDTRSTPPPCSPQHWRSRRGDDGEPRRRRRCCENCTRSHKMSALKDDIFRLTRIESVKKSSGVSGAMCDKIRRNRIRSRLSQLFDRTVRFAY